MCFAVMLAGAFPGAALGQVAAGQQRPPDDSVDTVNVYGRQIGGLGLDETSSAASRLGLSPFDTPASVDVISGEAIRARADFSINEAVTRAVGISSAATPGDGGTALSTRGFVGHNSVMQLLDGMRLFVGAGTVTFPFDPWSVERIEVLHGPASVMYGQGAIGGVVNIVSRQPDTSKQHAQARVALGEDATRRAAIDLTGPINSNWAYRLDVSSNRADNWVERGDSDSLAVASTLQWHVSDDLKLSLSQNYGDQNPMRYFGTPLVDGRLDESLRHENYDVRDAVIHYRDSWTRLKADWQAAPDVTVASQLYWLKADRQWRNAEEYIWDPQTALIDRDSYISILHHQDQLGNETDVKLSKDLFGHSNSFLIGFDANRVRFTHVNNSPYGGDSTVALHAFDPGLFIDLAGTFPRLQTRTVQYSLFTEDRFAVNEQWSLVGGARYDHASLERHDLVPGTGFDRTFSDISWRVGVVFQPNATTSFYGQYSTAVDPLGSLITISASTAAFDLATGRQIEVGVKQALREQRLEWTLAAYRIVKENLLTRNPASPDPDLVQQVGQQSSQGLEASVGLSLSDRWRIDANAALLSARFDDFAEAGDAGVVSRAGNVPPSVPEKTANLWVSWNVNSEWHARAGLRYVGSRFVDNANALRMPDYLVVDAGVDFAPTPSLSFTATRHNLTDEVYPVAAYTTSQWILGEPRTAVLQASYRF